MDNWKYNLAGKKRKIKEEDDDLNDELISKKLRSNGKQDDEHVNSIDNHIYFYSAVTKRSVYDLNREIKSVSLKMLEIGSKYEMEPPPIFLHINSYGGSIFSALSTIDTITTCKVPIYSIIEGAAASAATLISVVCKKRYIKPHSFMLIHQLSTIFWGKMHEFDDEIKNLENLMKMIKDIYKEHTEVPINKLDEILKHDLWWDADKCKEFKLVDDIKRD